MSEVRVRLFGAFRDCATTSVVSVSVVEPVTPTRVREALKKWIIDLKVSAPRGPCLDPALVDDSALATDLEILVTDAEISADMLREPLAILPPVCGG
jgi:hypothetical protein